MQFAQQTIPPPLPESITQSWLTSACLPCFVVGKECVSIGSDVSCTACIAAEDPCTIFGKVPASAGGEVRKIKYSTSCIKGVTAIAVELDYSLSLAIAQLEGARLDLEVASQRREELIRVSERLVIESESTSMLNSSRVNMYATVAARLRVILIGRDFPGSDRIPFADIAELYGVLKNDCNCNNLSDYEKTLLAFKVVRHQASAGERTDVFRDEETAVGVARWYLEELHAKQDGLYD